jgi:hypothetical protein
MNVFRLIEENGLKLHGDIEHFAELVAAAEREACAKVCDEVGNRDSDNHAWDAAAAIRARGQA